MHVSTSSSFLSFTQDTKEVFFVETKHEGSLKFLIFGLHCLGQSSHLLLGSLPPVVNLYRSCVGFGWLAQKTTEFILVRASEE
jgi:hypothetical protein